MLTREQVAAMEARLTPHSMGYTFASFKADHRLLIADWRAMRRVVEIAQETLGAFGWCLMWIAALPKKYQVNEKRRNELLDRHRELQNALAQDARPTE